MKKILVFIIILSSMRAWAQRSIDSMVQAERNFANTSRIVSTDEAFIKFIDSAGVVFDKGTPVNGLHLYSNSQRRPGILAWEPEYAEIASSNDFGYTTGPWEYYQNTLKDNPVASGYFVTVWHLTPQNKWKFLIDYGITCAKVKKEVALKKINNAASKTEEADTKSLNQAEEKFIQVYAGEGVKAYASFLSTRSRLNYAGFLPTSNVTEQQSLLDSLPRNINYKVLGSGLSPSKDLGYTYGTTAINDKHEGYLRIWRKEGNEWKIALEVLHFK